MTQTGTATADSLQDELADLIAHIPGAVELLDAIAAANYRQGIRDAVAEAADAEAAGTTDIVDALAHNHNLTDPR